MWILQRLFVVLAIAVVLLFGMLNAGEVVAVKYWFGDSFTFEHSPLPLVMVSFFLVGGLFYYLFSLARGWRLRNENRPLGKATSNQDWEVRDLRNISLDDVAEEQPVEVSGP